MQYDKLFFKRLSFKQMSKILGLTPLQRILLARWLGATKGRDL